MSDFCITEIQYSDDRKQITYVRVRENLFRDVGPARTVPRAFVADLIQSNKVTFKTKFQTNEGDWRDGVTVYVIGNGALTTAKDSFRRDGFENLPEF